MKIALFIDTVAFAGTERHVLDLGQSLVAAGAEVTIACPAASPLTPRCTAAGLPVLDVPSSLRQALRTVAILAAELRAGRVDIMHAHNGRTHLLSVAAVKRAGRGQVVATQHFLAPNRTGRSGPKAWLANQLHRWAEHNTAAFIAISNAVKDQMLLRGDAPAEKITVVHNGTGEPEATTPERIEELRAELGVGDRPMVFCAARLQKEKDVPTLIKAFALISSTNNEQRTTSNGVDPSRRARDKLPTQITQINDASRQVYPAGQNESAALPKHSNSYLLTPNFFPTLLLAGEGDQRAECERLIGAMRRPGGLNETPGAPGLMRRPSGLNEADAAASLKTNDSADIKRCEAPGLIKEAAGDRLIKGEAEGSSPVSLIPASRESHCNASPALPQHSNSYLLTPNSSQSDACGIALLGFRSDVSALMSACDIFVLPAPAEPFGLVLIEAMALGKPVIAAAAGGPLEIVADGETGLLFEPGNAESLAQAIKRLLADPDLRQRMGKAGRKRYEEHFTARRMAGGVLAAYAAAARRENLGPRS